MFTLTPLPRRILSAAALCLAFTLRIGSLDAYGLAEDETAKLRAVAAYGRGDFTANAEHPMLLKLAIWASLRVRDVAAASGIRYSVESAVRLPNVVAGTVTVALVGGAGTLLFSPLVGLLSAWLVAADPNVIALNRLAKEDTFLVLFFFLAVWCYERAKWLGQSDVPRARRWYTVAGTSFGLMLASKYLPHLLGLYALFNVIQVKDAGPNSPDKRRYFAAMGLAFVAANFAILLPSTWRYCLDYVQGHHLVHHGRLYEGRLYVTDVPVSFAGVPFSYYMQMLATKVPVPVLAAALIGSIPLVTRRTERGLVWLRVLLFFQLLGYSLFAAKFLRYGLSILVLVDMLAAVGAGVLIDWLASRRWPVTFRQNIAAGMTAAVMLGALEASLAARPFYSINQNAIGARLAPPVTIFPEESYDYGVREAVGEIARTAAPNAAIISDAPGAVGHYLATTGRPDLRVVVLSRAGIRGTEERWVLVQGEHTYFENVATVEQVRNSGPAWREYRMRDTPVLQLYRLPGNGEFAPAKPRSTAPRGRIGS